MLDFIQLERTPHLYIINLKSGTHRICSMSFRRRPSTGADCFIAKYNPDGFITNAPTRANSNVLVDATYLPSTMSPFINGNTQNTLAGTTLATTGVFIGGPSNYFNGTLSELLIYSTTLTTGQRQQVEGYLARKWGLVISNSPYYLFGPALA
jgi:hypothetical protein